MRSPNILWMKSDTWFRLGIYRLYVIQKYQLRLSRLQPSNLGMLTLILMFMLRSIFTTPKKLPTVLKGFLYEMRYQEIRDRFGMFFIHMLEKESNRIEGLPKRDSEEVKKLVFVYQKGRKERVEEERDISGERNEEFPIGDRPSWSELEKAIRSRPVMMMREGVWGEERGVELLAIELFMRFSREYWVTIREEFLVGGYPEVKTLEEALSSWSVEEIESRMRSVTFEAVRAYWTGLAKGRLENTFEERLGIFFPPADHRVNEKSSWKILWEYGYIGRYHVEWKKLGAEGRVRLNVGLKRLLGHVQCLPAAARCTEGTTGYMWSYNESKDGVKVLTNPKYYRIRGIGKEEKGKGIGRIMASRKEIELRIRMENEGISMEELERKEKVRKRNDKRSGRAKNARKPPGGKK